MLDSKDVLINRVASSGIITFNLEDLFPKEEFYVFDLKDYLFKELILKEKDFRTALKEFDWSTIQNKIVLVYCSSDAIIPLWAYMLVSSYASEGATKIWQGTKESFLNHHYQEKINEIDPTQFDEKRVVIKGCSNQPVPPHAYAKMVELLKPHAQSIMFGEPCSTVPIFKRPRKLK